MPTNPKKLVRRRASAEPVGAQHQSAAVAPGLGKPDTQATLGRNAGLRERLVPGPVGK